MLKAGIVGLPNVGKSTLFNAVTRTRKAEAANYPFCTIDPNVGIVTVPDARARSSAKIAKTQVIIPAAVEFVDIAGLVKGAAPGRRSREQISHPHPRSRRHRPGRPLLRRRRIFITSPARSIPFVTSKRSPPNSCLSDLEAVKKTIEQPRQRRQARRQSRHRRRREVLEKTRTALEPGQTSAPRRTHSGRKSNRARLFPPHGQADDLRRQR